MSDVDLDLDAFRAAREARRQPRTMRLAGEVFNLPAEFRCSWVRLLDTGDDSDSDLMLQELLGEQAERFVELATLDDLKELGQHILEIYGLGSPESKASNGSSSTTGDRSRRTSGGSTASTSAKRSGARTRSASAG